MGVTGCGWVRVWACFSGLYMAFSVCECVWASWGSTCVCDHGSICPCVCVGVHMSVREGVCTCENAFEHVGMRGRVHHMGSVWCAQAHCM